LPTVLIVEDEPLVGQILHALLTDHGYRPIGPAPTLVAAKQAIAEHRLNAALLDIRLGGDDRSFEIAAILSALRIPFAFLSSYSAALIPQKYRAVPLLPKPYVTADVLALLDRLLDNGGPGTA
jgi:CheY-like chemotaxis protein